MQCVLLLPAFNNDNSINAINWKNGPIFVEILSFTKRPTYIAGCEIGNLKAESILVSFERYNCMKSIESSLKLRFIYFDHA